MPEAKLGTSNPHACWQERREEILPTYEERRSLRGLELTFGASHHSMISWIKKATKLPAVSEMLIEPDVNDAKATVLKLEELCSFILKKTKQASIWIALCRKTRQVVAYAVGDRSKQTCRRLWEAIPAPYSPYWAGHCYTDFGKAYQAVLPEG